MARAPVRQVSSPAQIRPAASPVDSYVRPPEPARSNLHDIANGLAALDSGLSSFLSKRQEAQETADRQRGEAAFHRNNATGWSEAVKQGLVPANASPIFMESYKRAQGNLSGIRLREKFRAEYLGWEGRNSDDPSQFQTFMSDFLRSNLGTEDPHVLSGLNPHVEALLSESYSTYSTEQGRAAYEGNVATQGAIAGETIQAAQASGMSREEGTDYDALWDQLIVQRGEALSSGVLESDYDRTLVNSIIAESVRSGNPEMLKLLDRTLPGHEHSLSSFPDYRSARDKAIGTLEDASRSAEIDGDRRQRKIDEERKRSITVGISRALARDPTADIPEEVVRELEKYDPNARGDIVTMRKSLLSGSELEEPESILEVQEAIRNGGGEEAVNAALLRGVVRSPETYTKLLDRVDKYSKARASGSGILTNQTAKRFARTIKDRTATDATFDPFGTRGLTDEGLQATHDLEFMLMDWESRNPDASFVGREKAINEVGQIILQRITDDGEYVSPDDANRAAVEANRRLLADEKATLGERTNTGSPDVAPDPDGEGAGGGTDLRPFLPDERVDNGDGSFSTERTITIQLPNGEWVNPPTLWMSPGGPVDLGGDEADVLEALRNFEDASGQQLPRFATVEEAVESAERRSEAGGAGAAEPDESVGAYVGDAPPDLESLDEESRTFIETEAKRHGVTPEEYNNAMWAKIKEMITGTRPESNDYEKFVDPQTTGSIGDAGKAIEAVLQDPPKSEGSEGFAKLEARVGEETVNRLIHIESSGKATAKAKSSSAAGLGQFIDSTWMATVKKHRPDLLSGRSRAQVLNLRYDPVVAIEMTTRHMEDNEEYLRKRGLPVTDGTLYLAHFSGVGTAARLLKADGGKPASTVYSARAVRANPSILQGKTIDQVIRWAENKMKSAGGKGHIARYLGEQREDLKGLGLEALVADSKRGHAPDLENLKPEVVQGVAKLQKSWGRDLPIVSGYRDPDRNAKAGGAKKSQHMHGNAVDIDVSDLSTDERVKLIRMASEQGFTGIGVYTNSLHLDFGGRRYWGPSFRSASLPAWAKEAIQEHMKRT